MDKGDSRNNKVIFVCHCLLNANVKVCGLATYGAVHSSVLERIVTSGMGIVQLPCPEFLYLGPRRWWQTRSQYDTPVYRAHCAALAETVVDQTVMYRDAHVEIAGILAVEGSPSCGVTRVYDHDGWKGRPFDVDPASARQSGKGIWVEELEKCFARRSVTLPDCVGVPNETDCAAGKCSQLDSMCQCKK